MEEKKTAPDRGRRTLSALLFPAALVYYEIVFRFFTGTGVFRWDTLLALGMGTVLGTLCRSRRRNRRITVILLILAAIPYGVEDFLHWQFQIFYDLNTIFNGAGHMLTGFTGDMFRLLFSPGGLLRLALYLAPGIGYALLSPRPGPAPAAGRRRATVLVKGLAVLLICRLAVGMAPALRQTYAEQYTFPRAVEQFGLAAGVCLDVREHLFGRASFQAVDALPSPSPAGTEAPDATPEPDYAPNVLPLPLDDTTASSDIQALNSYVATLQAERLYGPVQGQEPDLPQRRGFLPLLHQPGADAHPVPSGHQGHPIHRLHPALQRRHHRRGVSKPVRLAAL